MDYSTKWLVDAAANTGYDINQYLDTFQGAKSKGNSPLILRTRYFLDLANAIVKADVSVVELENVLHKPGVALGARRLCAAWFSGYEGVSQASEENLRHSHFISILEQVIEILTPLLDRQVIKLKPTYQPPEVCDEHDDAESTNSFDTLVAHVEALAIEEGHDAPRSPAIPTSHRTQREIKIEDLQESHESSIFFAAHCLLVDLHQLRAKTRKIWVNYKSGRCSIAYASLMTNTIIELSYGMEAAFYASIGIERSYYEIFYELFLGRATQQNTRLQEQHDAGVKDLRDLPADPRDFVFYDSWCLALDFIGDFADELNAEAAVKRQKAQDKRAAKRAKRAAKNNAALRHTTLDEISDPAADGAAAHDDVEGLVDSDAYPSGDVNTRHREWLRNAYGTSMDYRSSNPLRTSDLEDQVLYHLREALALGNVELSACFAVQIFTDVRDILGDGHAQPLADLDAVAEEVQVKARLFELKNRKRSKINTKHPLTTDHADMGHAWHCEAGNIATAILKDESGPHDSRGFYAQGNLRTMLANSPLAAGLFEFKMTITLTMAGCGEVDATGIFTRLLYFYEAAGHMGFVNRLSPDFEYLIEYHTAEHLFFGGRPKTLKETVEKFDLAYGYSHRTRKQRCGTASGNQRTLWTPAFPISKLLFRRLRRSRFQAPFGHMEELELLLLELNKKGSHHRIKMQPVGGLEEGAFADLKRWSRDDDLLSPGDFIDAFGRHLKSELKHSRFDYDALENRVFSVYEQAKRRCEAAGIDMGDWTLALLGDDGKSIKPDLGRAINRYMEGQAMRREARQFEGIPFMAAYLASEYEGAKQKEFICEALVWAIHDQLERAEKDGVKNLRDEVV